MSSRQIVLGIDFGTACTAAGAMVGGKVELVQESGDPVIPSVVHFPERGAPEVGRRAAMRMITDPTSAIRSVKRVLGLPSTAPLVRRFAAGAPFRVESVGDGVVFRLRSGTYAPEQVAAYVISRARELAEARFGGVCKRAIFTASAAPPAGYREAITRAARIAHLDVIEVLAEPIAGALSLGLHEQPAQRRLLVLDFGGGTFDVSAIVQDGLRFTPVATFGDPFLGGDDFDEALAKAVSGVIYKQSGYTMENDAVRWSLLTYRCEMAKRQLSHREQVPIAFRDAYLDKGRSRDLDLTLERAWVEAKWQPLIDRAEAVVDEALQRASWSDADIGRVALIGGSSLIPMFQRMVRRRFGEERVMVSAQADLAVALGAALLTARYAAAGAPVPTLTAQSSG